MAEKVHIFLPPRICKQNEFKINPNLLFMYPNIFCNFCMMICEWSELWNSGVMANFSQLHYLYLFHFTCDCLRYCSLNSNNKYWWGQKNLCIFAATLFLTLFLKRMGFIFDLESLESNLCKNFIIHILSNFKFSIFN